MCAMLSHYCECYKGSAAYNEATAMPVILENGRKVFGPPHKYNGPRPSHVCELYVTRIPTELDELGFLVWLHRIGKVYAFRLMMDTGKTTRGYAFVRFCCEMDALAAFELLKFLFVDGERISVFRSQGKNRLFVSGIPRQLPLSCLERGFRLCFPNMKSCTAYPPINKCLPSRASEENRGFAFIEFEDHEMALAAKKRLNTGRIGMWGSDLKIQWAKPKEELQVPYGQKNCEDSLISRVYPNFSKPNDYCAKLRLYCIANNLSIPVIVYGPSFRPIQLHYAGVLLKNSFTGDYCYYLIEIEVHKISDIHLLICEIAVKFLEEYNAELCNNTVVRVIDDTKAELVYTFNRCDQLKFFDLQNQIKYPSVLIELAASLHILGLQNHEKLLLFYKRSFLTHVPMAIFCLDINNPLTRYCSVLPKFRNNKKLNNNFNDFEITLLLMSSSLAQHSIEQLIEFILNKTCGDNVKPAESPMHMHHQLLKQSKTEQRCQYFTLKSQYAGLGIKYELRYVDMVGVEQRVCYHKEQRFNSNPLWIAGHSYRQSIYN